MSEVKQTPTEELLKMSLLDRARTVMAENPREDGYSAQEVLALLQEKNAVSEFVTTLDMADELRKFYK